MSMLLFFNAVVDVMTTFSDLSRINDLQQVILGTFSSQSEEVRSAASYALG